MQGKLGYNSVWNCVCASVTWENTLQHSVINYMNTQQQTGIQKHSLLLTTSTYWSPHTPDAQLDLSEWRMLSFHCVSSWYTHTLSSDWYAGLVKCVVAQFLPSAERVFVSRLFFWHFFSKYRTS